MIETPLRRSAPPPRLPDGLRAYAIGDVHGRLDLVVELLARIEADDRSRRRMRSVVIFLGDLIDRGPSSAAVVELLMARLRWADLVCLKGNHEAAMLAALTGHPDAARMWLTYGGLEALRSWGVDDAILREGDADAVIAAAREAVPVAHRRWLAQLPVSYRAGDYYFVHAGVRPGIAIERQAAQDSLWIRRPFLGSRRAHGAFVVHGHTVSAKIDRRDNRLGIDTGAYASGRLSAVGIEGATRWHMQTGAADDTPPTLALPSPQGTH